jgi:hypothetical protein
MLYVEGYINSALPQAAHQLAAEKCYKHLSFNTLLTQRNIFQKHLVIQVQCFACTPQAVAGIFPRSII